MRIQGKQNELFLLDRDANSASILESQKSSVARYIKTLITFNVSTS